MKNSIRIIAIIFLLAVIGFSGYKIGSTLWSYRVGSSTYSGLAVQMVRPSGQRQPHTETGSGDETDSESAAPSEEEKPPIEVDFSALLAANGDVIGWLYCEGTPINYPVTQAADNRKYLRHLLNGKYNIAGTLFADYRCEKPFRSRNTVIYGHNLRNSEMFGTLPDYEKEAYYREHPVIWLLTPNGNYKLSVIGGYRTDTASAIYDPQMTAGDLKSALSTVIRKMPYETAVDPSLVTRIVTLSTCSYESDDARYVLVASAEKVG